MTGVIADAVAERSVLGGVLLDRSIVWDVLDAVKRDDFADERHRMIFDAVTDIAWRNATADVVTVGDWLRERGMLRGNLSMDYLHSLSGEVPFAAAAVSYAEIVARVAVRRRLAAAAEQIAALAAADDGAGVGEDLVEAAGVLLERAGEAVPVRGGLAVSGMDELEAELREKVAYVPTPWPEFNRYLGGWRPGALYVIGARPGAGKALSLDTPLPTPSGWTTMGDVQEGDFVLGMDGRPTRVSFATEIQHDRECFEVEFSDGAVVVADAEHLWWTETRASRKAEQSSRNYPHTSPFARDLRWMSETPSVKTTAEIRETMRVGDDARLNHSVPLPAALDLPMAELPIDPYVLGYWLGDGSKSTSALTVWNEDVPHVLAEIERAGYFVSQRPDGENTTTVRFSTQPIRRGGPVADSATARMRGLGVLGAKHVPDLYLRASAAQRREVLAGLLDSDGTVSTRGAVSIDVVEKRVADGAAELARSLGYRVTIRTRRVAGRSEETSTCYRVGFTPHDVIGRLERKVCRLRGRARRPLQRYIVDVRSVPSVPVRCIQVDNADHMYLAGREMVPTHNTVVGLQAAAALAMQGSVGFVTLEMPQREIVRRLVAQIGEVSLSALGSHMLTDTDWVRVRRARETLGGLDLWVNDAASKLSEVTGFARGLHRRGHMAGLVVDYLQLLKGDSAESRQIEVAGLSRELKRLAIALNIPIIALSQLNRQVTARRGKDSGPQLGDLRESGAIEQDADVVMLLHREMPTKEHAATRDALLQVNIAKNRHGRTGEVALRFDGAYARVMPKINDFLPEPPVD